jgi:hypothetical protein
VAAEKSTERQAALEAVANALSSCFMRLSFQLPPQMANAWEDLRVSHDALSQVQKIWDVTSEVAVDRYRTRSAASFDINRRPVRLGYAQIEGDVIASTTRSLRFGNVTGVMLDLYPGLCMVQGKRDFDLVDLLDVQAQFHAQRFIETESVPRDSQVVDYAWLKSNKDGSRDRRFANNRQIPIALYGALDLSSPTGINEAYLFSNVEATANFASAFSEAKDAQRVYSSSLPLAADVGGEEDGVEDQFAVTVPDPVVMPWWVACGMVCVALIVALLSFSPPGLRAPGQVLPATLPASSATAGTSPGTDSASMRATAENAVPEKQREEGPGTPTAARPLVTVKTAANIRTAGTPSAGVIRVARPGEKFVEFSRVHGWIQIGPVGADAPIGWVGASLISSD